MSNFAINFKLTLFRYYLILFLFYNILCSLYFPLQFLFFLLVKILIILLLFDQTFQVLQLGFNLFFVFIFL